MPQIYFFDTCALIPCFQSTPPNAREQKRKDRVLQLIDRANSGSHVLLCSTLTVAECTVKAPARDLPAIFRLFNDSFRVVPYDSGCVLSLRQITCEKGLIPRCCDDCSGERQVAKVDAHILATAHKHHADVIFSADNGLCECARASNLIAINIDEEHAIFDAQQPRQSTSDLRDMFDDLEEE